MKMREEERGGMYKITLACFENQFRCRVRNVVLQSTEKVKCAARQKRITTVSGMSAVPAGREVG